MTIWDEVILNFLARFIFFATCILCFSINAGIPATNQRGALFLGPKDHIKTQVDAAPKYILTYLETSIADAASITVDAALEAAKTAAASSLVELSS